MEIPNSFIKQCVFSVVPAGIIKVTVRHAPSGKEASRTGEREWIMKRECLEELYLEVKE